MPSATPPTACTLHAHYTHIHSRTLHAHILALTTRTLYAHYTAHTTRTLHAHNTGTRTTTKGWILLEVLTLTLGSRDIKLVDVGGHFQARRIWVDFIWGSNGIVYVVDTSDHQRLQEAADELEVLLPLLFFFFSRFFLVLTFFLSPLLGRELLRSVRRRGGQF